MKKIILAFLLLVSCLSSIAQNYPKVKIGDFPKSDLPPATFDASKYKSSDRYYYGIDVPQNYKMARYAAFAEFRKEASNGTFGGSAILMMLYANGYGVNRNIALCLRLSSGNVGGAAMEIAGRKEHLEQMRQETKAGVFDICDDITSGYMEGLCQSLVSERLGIARTAKFAAETSHWSVRDKNAFNKLNKIATTFFNSSSDNEVDQSGTARAAIVSQQYDMMQDSFLAKFIQTGSCSFPVIGEGDFLASDRELNIVYKKIMNTASPAWGTITQDGIRQAQRDWVRYRDAWVEFGKIKCPQLPEWTWKTILTRERVDELKGFAE